MTAARRMALVAAGGALGGLFRVVLAVILPILAQDPVLVAPALLTVNVSGSLLAGVLSGLVGREARRGRASEGLEAAMLVGFCGGYTSYSAFVSSLHHGVTGDLPWTVALAAATFVLCPLAAAIGMRAVGGYPPSPASATPAIDAVPKQTRP